MLRRRVDPFCGGGDAAAVAKRSVLVCKKISAVCAKMAVYTVRITGWALKGKVEQGFKLLSAVPPEPKTHLALVD